MLLVVKNASARIVTSEIYTGALLEHALHAKKKIFLVNFSMLLEGDVIRYRLDSFYYCNKCLSHKNSTMNEKRFDVKQKYIPRPMANFIKSANTFSRIRAQDESGIKLMQKRRDSQ